MRISVFGLGYVGSVTAACFAAQGHDIIGVDVDAVKIDAINSSCAPVGEKGLGESIAASINNKTLSATDDVDTAILKTDISFICVGTPGKQDGSLDCSYLEKVCAQIGLALTRKNTFHHIIVRSTILPGTMEDFIIPLLEKVSGHKTGKDFGIAYNPEFLREGSALDDFRHPPKTVIGEYDQATADQLKTLYAAIAAPLFCCPIKVAEMIKYTDNAWHAAKIAFANEIGRLCKATDIDSHAVMAVFCRDQKLNISPAYLQPGGAFGGSCLPKDLRALTHKARDMNVHVPLLNSILTSNQVQIARCCDMILSHGKKKIGILGLSFKLGTDDMRESPALDIAHYLIKNGCDIRIYDSYILPSKLIGANRAYATAKLPDFKNILTSKLEDVLAFADIIVITQKTGEFASIGDWLRSDQHIIDFARIASLEQTHENYQGIGW